MAGSSGRTRRDRQSPENNDVTQPQFQEPGPSPRYSTRGSTQHVPLHGQDVPMPDTVFGGFLPIDSMFHDNPPPTYGTTSVPAGLTPQMADILYRGFLENLANWAYDHMKQRIATDAAAIPILKDIMAAHMQADMDDVLHNGNEHGDSQP
ncbi:uncharacterized protein N7506_005651 [Penicillium brevicompactum]|uniref:uncharacterized protein n=1 Tax=Penicillium brevicompactum TaxID=5074 RepID=UPI0025405231|nr:uncharacterized protein N7506_005651 [Penicillium brevicompactum]KAJ5335715.1 hypothetical protein N7506_005651 [Penicillium brevicompactum]